MLCCALFSLCVAVLRSFLLFHRICFQTITIPLLQVICFIFHLYIANLSVRVSLSSGMDRLRRKPLPASSSLRPSSYQLVPSPSHDQSRSSLQMPGSTQHLPSSPSYEYVLRSGTSAENSGQESNRETHEPLITYLNPPLYGKIWRTDYLRNVPWLRVGSLLLVLSLITASIILLIVSNGDTVSSWRVAPSIILSILLVISTACLSFSLASGFNVS